MKPITTVKRARRRGRRTYASPLREEQALRTRERITLAVAKVMARGISTLSVPAVARAAGVSVPTVYRHFRTKRELVRALGGYYQERAGLIPAPIPTDLEGWLAEIPGIFARTSALDATVQAAMTTDLANRMRRETIPARLRAIETMLAGVTKRLSPSDRERFRDVVLILMSSAIARAFKDYLTLSPTEAADRVVWTIRTLADSAGTS
ncbi:MAG TPA: helix-turn-helix domain-containing protein [Candidatus Dormibacteraeota bacterium]|jgi:AcrR family transcriptional regulator|nr:helix-turn-helix domain-containing protein [Candidatus Dormibacteraeota bacterium]